jgi:hypothetical protein
MNAKKVKQIRRAVRLAAANLQQIQAATAHVSVEGSDSVLLHPHCVRALIQAAKKDAEVQEKLHG